MKILLATLMPPQPQATNAPSLVTYALLTGLVARHAVTLLTVIEELSGEDKGAENSLPFPEWRAAGVTVHAIQRRAPQGFQGWQRRWRLASGWIFRRYPWRTVWFWEPRLQQRLDQLLAEHTFDLVLVDDNAMGLYHFRTTAPTIFIEHEVRRPRPVDWRRLAKSPRLTGLLAEMDWRRWRAYQVGIWRRFDRIQVFTLRDAAAIGEVAPTLAERVRVNPFSIVLPAPADPAQVEENLLVFTGGFSHQPNVDAALWLGQEIMPLLRSLVPGVRLLLVGSFPPPSVQALVCVDIQVTGWVPEIEPYLARAAVVVAPVRTGGGMRMKVLQGMALGKAVVTTPRGAEGLIGAEALPLEIAATAVDFVQITAALLHSPSRRQCLGEQARCFVTKHYSPAAHVQRLEAIYQELALE